MCKTGHVIVTYGRLFPIVLCPNYRSLTTADKHIAVTGGRTCLSEGRFEAQFAPVSINAASAPSRFARLADV